MGPGRRRPKRENETDAEYLEYCVQYRWNIADIPENRRTVSLNEEIGMAKLELFSKRVLIIVGILFILKWLNN